MRAGCVAFATLDGRVEPAHDRREQAARSMIVMAGLEPAIRGCPAGMLP
jgi:hypothetical protein